MRVLAALFLLVLVGCAQEKPPVPLCEKYGYMIGEGQDGSPVVIIDMENTRKLVAMLRGLNNGTCRLVEDKGAKNTDV